MILEHGIDPVSAKWNEEKDTWDVGEKVKWRWNTMNNKPASDWFYDIKDALNWIIEHDEKLARSRTQ